VVPPELAGGELERRGTKLAARPEANKAQANTWHRVLEWLAPIAFWIVRVSAVFGGLALAYLLYGIMSGALSSTVGQSPQVASNMQTAALIFNWALAGLVVAAFLLMWDEKAVAPVVAGFGLLLFFGAVPILKAAGNSLAAQKIADTLHFGGMPLLILGGLKYLYDLAFWLMDLPNRMRGRANVGVAQLAEPRQQREAANSNMFSPCWKLPFCREVIRKQCPAYLAKRTCWKFGRGCYCDEEMISRIIRGESLDVIKAPTRMSRQGKPPCGRCYIFLEHQGLKYKMLSPLAIPITGGIMYFGWDTYMALTGQSGRQHAGFVGQVIIPNCRNGDADQKGSRRFRQRRRNCCEHAFPGASTTNRAVDLRNSSGFLFADLYFQSHRMGYL
jgi:hypothetical protein